MTQNNYNLFDKEIQFSSEDPIALNKWYQEYRRQVLNLPRVQKSLKKKKKKSFNSK